jgi:hypothetical protein
MAQNGSVIDTSLGAQIRCVEREIQLRRRLYPRCVEGGKMAQVTATRELALMQAVLETLCAHTHKRAEIRTQLERIIGTLTHATHTVDVLHAQSIASDLLESLKGDS